MIIGMVVKRMSCVDWGDMWLRDGVEVQMMTWGVKGFLGYVHTSVNTQ